MAITRKPKPVSEKPSGVDVDALIAKGGSSPTEARPAPDEKPVPVLLRIPPQLLQQIDAALKARPLRIPRHLWILEAILEKLSRESA